MLHIVTDDEPAHGQESVQVSESYVFELTKKCQEPGLVIENAALTAALSTVGVAKSLSASDPFEPSQMHFDEISIGVITANTDPRVLHWHPQQIEVYAIFFGDAEFLCKYQWDDVGWVAHRAAPGRVLIVQPQVCHWFRWKSRAGFAYVFKAPQIAGVGPNLAGEVVCTRGCPHFNNGCVLPAEYDLPKRNVA